MAGREDVTRERLRALLEAIGSEFRHPARLYLSGGEGLVWRGLRGSTKDVDVCYEVDPRHHDAWIRCLTGLKERLGVNIEEAAPGDFIPLPPGHESRATHAGRFGSVDAYLFDPYSVAISKLERGHVQDMADVRELLGHGILEGAELRRLVEAILPAYATRSLRSNPKRLLENLEEALRG